MDEYAYGVPQKYDPNSRMLARKVDKVFVFFRITTQKFIEKGFNKNIK